MRHYAISGTAKSVRTGCRKLISRTRPWSWTTAAASAAWPVQCPGCLESLAWRNRAGYLGVGDPAAPTMPDEPEGILEASAAPRFNKTMQPTGIKWRETP